MAAYQTFTSARATEPDRTSLLAQLRALDATAGVQHDPGTSTYRIKKATDWTGPQVTAAQNVLDTAPASTPQLTAQAKIDSMDIFDKARDLLILDQFNLMRAKLRGLGVTGIPDLTVAQYLQAMKDKAGTL